MIPLSVFERHKCDTASLKALFDLSEGKKESAASVKIREYIREIVKAGIERSLADYQDWAAVDLAYNAPFDQKTPTIMRAIIACGNDAKKALDTCRSWGLCEGDLFCKSKGPKGEDVFELNAPAIFTTLVPIVRAYVTVRTAKIFNDRNLSPLLNYEPLYDTSKNRVRCQIVTHLVQQMATTMGFTTALQRLIFNPMLYSSAIKFPMEPWFQEKAEDEAGATIIEREGVRYAVPHITRTFYDLQHPLATLNTDTGCCHAGYWTIDRYRDVERNKKYWNRDKISYGFDWMSDKTAWRNYFVNAYPCTMQLPKPRTATGVTDREAAADYYSQGDMDKAIFVTPTFLKLVPKDWGIGTYEHPVWFRFFIGADDTILYAEPFPYRPTTVAQYDPDQNRAKNASLALEIIPSQDMIGNLLTQIVLTIKRNLANVTFYDTNLNIGAQMEDFQRRNQWQYTGLQFVGYDSLRNKIGNLPSPRDSFHSITFPFADTSGMFGAINTVISLLERMLVISAQEIGAAASHQQSVREVNLITANTSNRVAYTASFIDEAIRAWKAQIYDALLVYGPDEFKAEIASDTPNLEAVLKELELEREDEIPEKRRIVVKGKKKMLKLEGFASNRDGPERQSDVATAQAEMLALSSMNQNPAVAQIADPESILDGYIEAAKLAGARKDFKIRTRKEAVVAGQVAQIGDQIKQAAVAEAVQQANATIAKPAAEAVAQHSKQIAQTEEHLATLAATVEQIKAVMEAAAQAPPLPPPNQFDNATTIPAAPGGPPAGALAVA